MTKCPGMGGPLGILRHRRRALWSGLIVGVVCAVTSAGLVAEADEAAPADFVRIAVDVPIDGATVEIGYSITVTHFGPAPLILGQAVGLRNGLYRGGVAAAQRLAPGGGVTASVLGSRVSVAPIGLDWQISSTAPLSVFPVDDDGVVELIVFVPDAELVAVGSIDVQAPAGSTTTITTGRGAHTVAVGDVDDGASGVVLNGFARGSSNVARDVSEGITGAIVTGACTSCEGAWRAPGGGFDWSWQLPGDANGWDNRQHFRGPGGSWKWTWRGASDQVADGSAVYAAYVDVGDDWVNF